MLKRSTPIKRSPLVRKAPDKATLTIKPRKAKCKHCGTAFERFDMRKTWCSPECGALLALNALEKARKAKAAKEKSEDKAKLVKLEGRPYWLKRAETAVNRYVRARDKFKGCISCSKPATWDGQWHASHFRSVGAASSVRYHLWNVNKACWICNKHHSGNLAEYGPRLVALIGQQRVDWLKAQNGRADYSIEYLQRLTKVMNRKALRQEKRNAMQG